MLSEPQIQQLTAQAEGGHAESQFLLSQICLHNGDVEGMRRWLEHACGQNLPDAIGALGDCHERGLGVTRDFEQALAHYDRAIDLGSAPAAFRKAELLYKSRQATAREPLIYELLVLAADAGFPLALRALGYVALQDRATRQLALNCLRRAAHQGDPVSAFAVAWRLLHGGQATHRWAEAVYWLRLAATADFPYAGSLLASLPETNETPTAPEGSIEWPASLPLFPTLERAERQALSEDPAVVVFEDVLNLVDCAYLIQAARPHLERADVINPDGDKDGMVSEVRTNASAYLPFERLDFIARFIELKIIDQTGGDLAASEPLSILHYAPGQFYRPHVDYFDPKLPVSEELLRDGGQRTASAITCLAAPEAGGATSFPTLEIEVAAKTGRTVWFRNCHDDGAIDRRTLHSGEPVDDGEKWVVTKWFRERPTKYLEY